MERNKHVHNQQNKHFGLIKQESQYNIQLTNFQVEFCICRYPLFMFFSSWSRNIYSICHKRNIWLPHKTQNKQSLTDLSHTKQTSSPSHYIYWSVKNETPRMQCSSQSLYIVEFIPPNPLTRLTILTTVPNWFCQKLIWFFIVCVFD